MFEICVFSGLILLLTIDYYVKRGEKKYNE